MILAEKLSRKYGENYAVRDLSFHVKHGEVMGILGPNGAGKSTTMKMLTCFLPPSSGEASLNGIDIQQDLEVRRMVGYLPEQAPLYTDLDVYHHLSFIGRMHAIPEATLRDKITEMSVACGLDGKLHRRIDELSKGYRQRVGLAASMLHEPECLILDEPTTGLDPNQIIEIRHLIRRLGEKKTVLLSSHVLSEVEAVCERVMIIDHGELQAMGTCAELIHNMQAGVVLMVRIAGDVSSLPEQLQSQLHDVQLDVLEQDDNDVFLRLHSSVLEQRALAEHVFACVVKANATLLEMYAEKTSLEDVFQRLTTGSTI
jgi:ABC-2 type transport system ATP-binding protein